MKLKRKFLTVAPGEVPALDHEVLDDPVEFGADIALALAAGALRTLGVLLAKLLKILSGPGDGVAEEADLDLLVQLPVADFDREEDLVGHLQ